MRKTAFQKNIERDPSKGVASSSISPAFQKNIESPVRLNQEDCDCCDCISKEY